MAGHLHHELTVFPTGTGCISCCSKLNWLVLIASPRNHQADCRYKSKILVYCVASSNASHDYRKLLHDETALDRLSALALAIGASACSSIVLLHNPTPPPPSKRSLSGLRFLLPFAVFFPAADGKFSDLQWPRFPNRTFLFLAAVCGP